MGRRVHRIGQAAMNAHLPCAASLGGGLWACKRGPERTSRRTVARAGSAAPDRDPRLARRHGRACRDPHL